MIEEPVARMAQSGMVAEEPADACLQRSHGVSAGNSPWRLARGIDAHQISAVGWNHKGHGKVRAFAERAPYAGPGVVGNRNDEPHFGGGCGKIPNGDDRQARTAAAQPVHDGEQGDYGHC